MKVQLSVKRLGTGAGLALAGLTVAGAAVAQRRHEFALYYADFRSAIDTALGHYRASAEAAAHEGVRFTAAHDIIVGRPPVRIDDRFGLHCDIAARAQVSSLHQLHFSVTGPEQLVRSLLAGLCSEPAYAAVYATGSETRRGDSLTIRFAITLFAGDDTRVARVAKKLQLARR